MSSRLRRIHGALYDGRPVGSFSHVASFSFFANKIITTGEGGIYASQTLRRSPRACALRDHGMRPETLLARRCRLNFRMTNLQADIGCAQLERMHEFLAERRRAHAI
jgi:perosamine synthetase